MTLRYLTANELLIDSQQLALNMLSAGFEPDLLIALWRGGAPIGIAMHEVLVYLNFSCSHLPIIASSYVGIRAQQELTISGLEQLLPYLKENLRIIVVDDVFDTGKTMHAVYKAIEALAAPTKLNIRIGTVWYKPANNQTPILPDFYLYSTEDWLVFPHELHGLSDEALLAKPSDNNPLLQKLVELRHCKLFLTESSDKKTP